MTSRAMLLGYVEMLRQQGIDALCVDEFDVAGQSLPVS